MTDGEREAREYDLATGEHGEPYVRPEPTAMPGPLEHRGEGTLEAVYDTHGGRRVTTLARRVPSSLRAGWQRRIASHSLIDDGWAAELSEVEAAVPAARAQPRNTIPLWTRRRTAGLLAWSMARPRTTRGLFEVLAALVLFSVVFTPAIFLARVWQGESPRAVKRSLPSGTRYERVVS